MSTYVGIFREEADMQTGLNKLQELKEKFKTVGVKGSEELTTLAGIFGRDLRNMLICSEAITLSALHRKESRGAHSRLDFPKMEDDPWSKVNTSVYLKDGEMTYEHTAKPEMPEELKELFKKKPEPVKV